MIEHYPSKTVVFGLESILENDFRMKEHIMENDQNKEPKLIHHSENKKTIRHEDFIAGISKGLAILECFGPERHRLNMSTAALK